jgi:Flp pilus assembly protein TadG
MIHRVVRRDKRRGVAAVEFAFVMPAILALLVGIWELGRLIEIQQLMTNAAREGARQAATGQYTKAQTQSIINQYLTVAGLPTTNVSSNAWDITNNCDPSAASYQDCIQVNVSMPFADVSWSVLSILVPPTFQISTQVQWMTVIDKPYPSDPEPPVG